MANLFFIHGFATTPEVWKLQTEGFSKDNDIVCMTPNGRRATIRMAQPQPKNAIIVGWSLGALDAVKLYFEQKDNIKALVLVSAFPKFLKSSDYPYGLSPALLRKLEKKIKADFAAGIEYFYSLLPASSPPAGRAGKLQAPSSKQISIPKSQILNKDEVIQDLERLKTEDIRPLLPKIDVPVLLIHGKQDQIVPVESAEYMARNIPDSELIIFDGAGHAPFLEEPERFNSLLKDFICKITNKK